jgi:hypothetical protein
MEESLCDSVFIVFVLDIGCANRPVYAPKRGRTQAAFALSVVLVVVLVLVLVLVLDSRPICEDELIWG